MKYLKLFQTKAEREAFEFDETNTPNVNYCEEDERVQYIEKIPKQPNQLCFTALEDSSVSMLYRWEDGEDWGDDVATKNTKYSFDRQNWIEWDGSSISLTKGQKIYFKGDNDTYSDNRDNYYHFSMTGLIAASGNINSLINFKDSLEGCDYCYYCMFLDCDSLTTAPELPATTLAEKCYSQMFYGCTSLVSAPELPATTLAEKCYDNMYGDCTSLVSAPELPATTLAVGCYDSMFYGCTSLTTAPELPAIELEESCYTQMFDGCTSLNVIKCMATSLDEDVSQYWLHDVSGSGIFYKNPLYTPSERGESTIPEGWEVRDWV